MTAPTLNPGQPVRIIGERGAVGTFIEYRQDKQATAHLLIQGKHRFVTLDRVKSLRKGRGTK